MNNEGIVDDRIQFLGMVDVYDIGTFFCSFVETGMRRMVIPFREMFGGVDRFYGSNQEVEFIAAGIAGERVRTRTGYDTGLAAFWSGYLNAAFSVVSPCSGWCRLVIVQ